METFNNVINSDQLVLVDFFATWCQPCKAMHPILEQVKSVLGDRIRIIKVDVDKYGVTASQYRIQSVPTLMLFQMIGLYQYALETKSLACLGIL